METEEFEQIVQQFYEPLYRFAYCLTRAEADACDLTQHAFYIWATKSHQLRDRSKVKSWLFTTLHRAFLQTCRKQQRFPQDSLEEAQIDHLADDSPELANELDAPKVLEALAKLDSIYQGALALFYLEERSYLEIAAILDIPIGTVKSRLARGIVQLRKILCGEKSDSGFRTSAVAGSSAELIGVSEPTFTCERVRQISSTLYHAGQTRNFGGR